MYLASEFFLILPHKDENDFLGKMINFKIVFITNLS